MHHYVASKGFFPRQIFICCFYFVKMPSYFSSYVIYANLFCKPLYFLWILFSILTLWICAICTSPPLALSSSSISALPAVHRMPHNLQWSQEQRASPEVEPPSRVWTMHTEECPFCLLCMWPPVHKLHRAHGPSESPHREETLQVSDLWIGLQQVIRAHRS